RLRHRLFQSLSEADRLQVPFLRSQAQEKARRGARRTRQGKGTRGTQSAEGEREKHHGEKEEAERQAFCRQGRPRKGVASVGRAPSVDSVDPPLRLDCGLVPRSVREVSGA